MVYYELIKVIIDILDQVKVNIDMIIRNNRVSESIITDQRLLFISKILFFIVLLHKNPKKQFITFNL